VGTGKTFTSIVIMTMLLNKTLAQKDFKVVYLELSYENFEVLLCQIVNKLTNKTVDNLTEATNLFRKVLQEIRKEGSQLVLILDESQDYDRKTLDQIRQLSNYNTSYKYLSILLVGQPELREKIVSMKQLASRIKVKQYLNNLNVEEVPHYISFRMQAAGFSQKTNPFTPYIKEIYAATGGMPRYINTLCTSFLMAGASQKTKRIDKILLKKLYTNLNKTFMKIEVVTYGQKKKTLIDTLIESGTSELTTET
jgi:Archaeal ATPase.